jgi:hypothetical protein
MKTGTVLWNDGIISWCAITSRKLNQNCCGNLNPCLFFVLLWTILNHRSSYWSQSSLIQWQHFWSECINFTEFIIVLYICCSMHHQSILLNNQRDAALSSRIYSSLRGYSTCFGCFLHPSSGVQLKLQMQSQVQVMCRCGVV